MTSLQMRLKKFAAHHQTTFEIIEQDYVLSWMLFGIANHQMLSKALVFKGGTALKKCYFGDYRFSQDLDFTLIDSSNYDNLYSYIKEACDIAKNALNLLDEKFEIICKEYQEGKPHPHGQKAYILHAQLYWHRQPLIKIKIEITKDELVINPAQLKQIIHPYEGPMDAKIKVYSLEEIILEKLRAIVEKIIKLHEKGWGRSRARDFYDIWMIYNRSQEAIDKEKIRININRKFAIKGLKFKSLDAFFDPAYINVVISEWEQWLKPFVRDLPPAEVVLQEIKDKILPQIFLS